MKTLAKKSIIALSLALIFLFTAVFVTNDQTAALAMETAEEGVQSQTENNITRSSGSSISSYTYNIVDGGLYYFKNTRTGNYLTVYEGGTTNGTKLWTTASNSSDSQKFYVYYLGQNLYEIVPLITSKVIRVESTSEDAGVSIYTKSRTNSLHTFKIRALDNSNCVIYSGGDTTKALTVKHEHRWIFWPFSSTYDDKQDVISKTYDDLGTDIQNFAQWEPVQVNNTYKGYSRYFIKNRNTGRYLEVYNNGTALNTPVYAATFTGKENQQWRYSFNTTTQNVMLKPEHRTDMALDAYQENLVIYSDTLPNDQSFEFELAGTDGTKAYYRIKTSASNYTKYLNVGTYNSSVGKYNVISGTDSSQYWYLEEQPFAVPNMQKINLNGTYTRTITDYGQTDAVCVDIPASGMYEFTLRKSSNSDNIAMGVYEEDGTAISAFSMELYNLTSGQKIICRLEGNKRYFIVASDVNYGLNKTFYLLVSPATIVYLHGMDTSVDDKNQYADRRTYCTEPIRDFLINSDNGWAPVLNSNSNMTSTFVRNVDSYTGIIPLNAPVYMFRGHGYNTGNGVIYSTGTNSSAGTKSDLRNWNIASMSLTSGFVAWIACNTAIENTTTWGNITEATVEAGAQVSLGFTETIYAQPANDFGYDLMHHLLFQGTTVQEAVQQSVNKYLSAMGLQSWVIEGNGQYKVSPGQITPSSVSAENVSAVWSEIQSGGYELEFTSADGSAARYTKTINGIMTADYYELYYDQAGTVIDWYKSPCTISAQEKSAAQTKSTAFTLQPLNVLPLQTISASGMVFDQIESQKTFDYFLEIDGVLQPVRFYQTIYRNAQGVSHMELNGVNLLTGQAVSNDYLKVGD